MARRFVVALLSLAMVIAFVSTATNACADGPHGAGVASILAAESSPGAPLKQRAPKAKAAGHAKAKHSHHATKARRASSGARGPRRIR